MIEFYPQIKWVHVAAVLASGSLFLVRGIAVHAGARWPMTAPLRYLSYTIDTVLLTAALMLVTILHQYPFVHGWLTVKILLLVIYVGLGTYALKRGRTRTIRVGCWLVHWLSIWSSSASPARIIPWACWFTWLPSGELEVAAASGQYPLIRTGVVYRPAQSSAVSADSVVGQSWRSRRTDQGQRIMKMFPVLLVCFATAILTACAKDPAPAAGRHRSTRHWRLAEGRLRPAARRAGQRRAHQSSTGSATHEPQGTPQRSSSTWKSSRSTCK